MNKDTLQNECENMKEISNRLVQQLRLILKPVSLRSNGNDLYCIIRNEASGFRIVYK